MANQTIAAIPSDISNQQTLRRVLVNITEQLDIVLGNRAGASTQYVPQEALIAAATALQERLTQAEVELREATVQVSLQVAEFDKATEDRLAAIELKNTQQDADIIALQTAVSDLAARVTALENAGYITDAPSDGTTYGRNNAVWVNT